MTASPLLPALWHTLYSNIGCTSDGSESNPCRSSAFSARPALRNSSDTIPGAGAFGHCALQNAENFWIIHHRDVEAHETSGRLRDAENVARREQDVVGKGASGDVGGIDVVRQLAP